MHRKTIFILFFCFIIYGWIELEALILIGSIFGGLVAFLGLFLTAFAGVFEVVEGVIMRDFLELTMRVDFRRSPTALAALAADAAVGFIRELRRALLIR